MTRDAEHAPSPQSVVVPVEPTEAMLGAAKPWPKHWPKYEDASESARVAFNVDRAVVKSQWRDMLAAAPAPSSLAGGETEKAAERLRNIPLSDGGGGYTSAVMDVYGHEPVRQFYADIATILAALSPEAPAREGVVKACADFQEAIDYFEADVADALAEDSERADLWDREVTVNIDALKTVMNAALTPRHEAPAEVAVISWEGTEEQEHSERLTACSERRAQWGDDDCEARDGSCEECTLDMAAALETEASKALRARSSAPEAREGGAVGWLWRSQGGTIKLTTWHPDTQAESAERLYTHPAAPSADTLRIAVEALEPFSAAFRGLSSRWEGHETHWQGATSPIAVEDLRRADQALDALKAEGAA